jgi:acyl-CoA-binding protein
MIESKPGTNNRTTLTATFQDTSYGFSGGDRPGAYTMFLQIQGQ